MKTRQCIFIGYGTDECGYKFYDPVSKKIIWSRDTIFVEDQTLKNIDKIEKLVVLLNDDVLDLVINPFTHIIEDNIAEAQYVKLDTSTSENDAINLLHDEIGDDTYDE